MASHVPAHPLAAGRDLHGPRSAVEYRDQRDRGERRLQQEDAAPAEELGEQTTERGTERGTDRPRDAPHRDRVRVAAADTGEHRYRARQRERGAEALDAAPDEQHLEGVGEPAHER